MFGLLGGLLGGGLARRGILSHAVGHRPLAGLLANRVMSHRGGPQQSGGGAPPQAPQSQEQQEAPPQQAPQDAEPSAPVEVQAAEPKPMVQQASQKLESVEQQAKTNTANPPKQITPSPVAPKPQENREVTAGLMDEAPAIPDQGPRLGADQPPEPQQVVNQTETETPVAMAADEKFPNTPQTALSGLVDKIDDAPPRRTFPMEDPNPTKPVDTKSQAAYTANSPGYEYQTAGSWTAMTPNYSYRR